jgi:hypothetical protein
MTGRRSGCGESRCDDCSTRTRCDACREWDATVDRLADNLSATLAATILGT